MIRAELMREVDGERDGFGIWLFSPLETLFAVFSIRLHFVSHFFPSQM